MAAHDPDLFFRVDRYDARRIVLPIALDFSLVVLTYSGLRSLMQAPPPAPPGGSAVFSSRLAGLSQLLLGAMCWYSSRPIAAKIGVVNRDTTHSPCTRVSDLISRPVTPLSYLARQCAGAAALGVLVHGVLANAFLSEKDGIVCSVLHTCVGLGFSAALCLELENLLRAVTLRISPP